MHNDLHNLRGQPPMPKPDAANPRQVDAGVGLPSAYEGSFYALRYQKIGHPDEAGHGRDED
jgi:hypothetical protein